MDINGKIITREYISIKPLSELRGKNKEIKEIVKRIGDESKLRETDVLYAGIAIPERMGEKIPKSKNILAEGISRLFDCEVLIAAEATAAGYEERNFKKHDKKKGILYMHLDVGNGVVIKDEMIFEADKTKQGEDKAYLCPWNQFSMVLTAKSLVNKGLGTSIVNMVEGNVDAISLDIVLRAAESGDELAMDLVKRSALALGMRTAYLVNMFNIEVVILGGGIEKDEGSFAQFVKESAERFLLKRVSNKLEIVSSELGKEASSIGAASLCWRETFMEV